MNNSPNTPSPSPWADQNATTSSTANSSADATRQPDSLSSSLHSARYGHNKYILKKQFLKMLGGTFRIYDEKENLLFFSKRKSFKLKEDIRLWTGEDMAQEILSIKARKMLDISATYDVVDSASGEKIGALRRKGLKSMLQDEWHILDTQDREVGYIKEDSTALALIRRFIDMASLIIPQSFHGFIGGKPVCLFSQNRNPFLARIDIDFSVDTANLFDRRLGIAAALLLCAIEGKQR